MTKPQAYTYLSIILILLGIAYLVFAFSFASLVLWFLGALA